MGCGLRWWGPPLPSTRVFPALRPQTARLPHDSHSYYFYDLVFPVMSTDIATDTALRVTCSKSDARSRSRRRRRGPSRRAGRCRFSAESSCRPRTAGSRSPRPTWRSRCARRSTARSQATRASSCPGRLLTDLVRLLPDDTVTLVHEEGDGVLSVTSGSHSSRLNVYSAEDFPRLPPTRRPASPHRDERAPRDDRQGRPGSVA